MRKPQFSETIEKAQPIAYNEFADKTKIRMVRHGYIIEQIQFRSQ